MHLDNHFLDDLSVKPIRVDQADLPAFKENHVRADVLRLDRIHEVVSGNKIFKLKHHLKQAIDLNCREIFTFGGPWSNHLVATAFASRELDLPCTGFVRGEEPATYSATLLAARKYGMRLRFLPRSEYDEKSSNGAGMSNGIYTIPAGGAGADGIRGSSEIAGLTGLRNYSHIACSIGTGTMFTGLALALESHQKLLGIPAIKGFTGLPPEYQLLIRNAGKENYLEYFTEYHFGGFARKNNDLTGFMNFFFEHSSIPSDIVYTGKLFYACVDLATKKYFAGGSRLLIIHSGGLQGNSSLPAGVLDF